MNAENCVFCKIVAGEIPSVKIYENDSVLAFIDIGPISNGHTLVIPKAHFEKLHDCPPEVLSEVYSVIGKIAGAVVSAVKAEGYNAICNNGRVAGQLVDHMHFHIIPRNAGDGLFSSWPAFKYEAGIAEKIADKIKQKL